MIIALHFQLLHHLIYAKFTKGKINYNTDKENGGINYLSRSGGSHYHMHNNSPIEPSFRCANTGPKLRESITRI
ncbi:hypothetical protein JHK82_041002 [Glycine max]|nr:hypothetical protein JHK82_041002 [Glycine max]KAG5115160.1 hypothetical protein JHK84_041273 [Glycine max]